MSSQEASEIIEESFSGTQIGDVSFVEALSNYYSDFLSTDFKKGHLPKRRFISRDPKGRRAGIPLAKFPRFEQKVRQRLLKEIGNELTFQVSFGTYKSELPAVTKKGIQKSIRGIKLKDFETSIAKLAEDKHGELNKNKAIDLESFQETLANDVHQLIAVHIGATLIDLLEPVFKKSSSNLLESLIGLENDIASLLSSEIEGGLPTAIAETLMSEENAIMLLFTDCLKSEEIIDKLEDFFQDFSAGDLHTEISELLAAEKLADNLEFYCYLGELKYNGNIFPMGYVPVQIETEKNKFNLSFDTRLLFNKRAIDYLIKISQEQFKLPGVTPITKRINYLDQGDSFFSVMDTIAQESISAMNLVGSFSFQNKQKQSLKNSIIQVNNGLSFALFDKSDESMLSDFEELLADILNGGEIFHFIEDLIHGFLEENPISIDKEINDGWDELGLPDKLVFETPLPLAEEQRKILDAVKNDSSRFIAVEGPPGTGKSHTISAVVFDAILSGKSTLVLSDKIEALDVVENKLNDTLAAVRPSSNFVNPLLRLGRAGNNFNKILNNKTVEKLRTQSKVFEEGLASREKEYQQILSDLRSDITNNIELAKKINLAEILELEGYKDEILDELDDDCSEEFLADYNDRRLILAIVKLRERILEGGPEVHILSHFLKKSKGLDAASKFFSSIKTSKETELKTVFERYPNLDLKNYFQLDDCFAGIRDAAGFFGYLFAGNQVSNLINKLNTNLGSNIGKYNSKPDDLMKTLKRDFLCCEGFIERHPKMSKQNLMLVRDRLACNEKEFKELKEELNQLEILIENSNIDESFEDCCKIIFSKNDEDTEYYFLLGEVIRREQEISQNFDIPEYNYLAQKTRLENFNAQVLANEIDKRAVKFAEQNRADKKELSGIIRKKARFPRDKFEALVSAFPCMICSLRDYAEYIPLEQEIFDLIIIDEASQVSIAQALPAIVRSKKLLVLGDRLQFGNVKTANASKETNSGYFQKVMMALGNDRPNPSQSIQERAKGLNISNSVMDFMETVSNFNIMLKKHFRGYPEMISFSSKYFYEGALQPMKIRGQSISDVLEFAFIEPEEIDPTRNTNSFEAEFIIDRMVTQIKDGDFRSVCVITPFTEQQTLISRMISDHEKYEDFISKLKFRCFTFDSCQGEERDIVYYSFVASKYKDRLSYVFPKYLKEREDEELDGNLRRQRLNVGFSRGKEKLVFVLSKPIEEISSSLREALNHYKNILEIQSSMPTEEDVDQSSKMEKKVLKWLKACDIVMDGNIEIQTQFPLGEYLKSIDPSYNHPAYTVDFLLQCKLGEKTHSLIVEYDGFNFHFLQNARNEINEGNWEHYLTENDIERERVLESYGYKMLRINKFNLGENPIDQLNKRIKEFLEGFSSDTNSLTRATTERTQKVLDGELKLCKKCGKHKTPAEFRDPTTRTGFRRLCKSCKKESNARRENFLRGRRSGRW